MRLTTLADPMYWIELLKRMATPDQASELLIRSHPGSAGNQPGFVAVVGASELGIGLARQISAAGTRIVGLFDDDPERQNVRVGSVAVRPTVELSNIDREIPVIMATHRVLGLKRRIEEMSFTNIWPFPVLALRWPHLFQPHPFYEGLHDDLISNRISVAALPEKLTDDFSCQVLDAVVGFRLTLDADLLKPYVTPDAYFARDVLSFNVQETMIDGGAFNGDTIMRFLKLTGGTYRKIVSFEPSSKIYDELLITLAGKPNIRCMRACLYDQNTFISFDDKGARDSAINEGSELIPATAIDLLPEANEVTFIKLNIEGAEEKALHGATNVIIRNAPKLALAVYHRPHDLWLLPQLLHQLRPDYRLYLRQHDGGLIETVLYASLS